MKDAKYTTTRSRRQFLKNGAALAASSFLISGFASALSFDTTSALPFVTLNNGAKMPILGFGTNTLKGEIGINSVAHAIRSGYRLIDTATIYGNEQFVGEGIKQSGIDRKELFITTKMWVDDYPDPKAAFETSLQKLQTDYVDLYLLHRPRGAVKNAWLAMEELYKEGKIKAIGISNFEPKQIEELLTYATVKPAVNQIETHAFFHQFQAIPALKSLGIQHEAWSPLAEGRNQIFSNEVLARIGKQYNKSNAQVSLRWHYQRGIVAIPRSSNKGHIKENLEIFDFELSEKDLKMMEGLDLNKTQFPEWG